MICLPGDPLATKLPALTTIAAGANKPARPAFGSQIARTGGDIGKARLKLSARHRTVISPAAGMQEHYGNIDLRSSPKDDR